MGTSDNDTLNQQRLRRRRVNRMKKAIVITIAVWMLGSLIAIVLLSVGMISLQRQLKNITTQLNAYEGMIPGTEREENVSSVNDTQDSEVLSGIDDPENLAKEGDTHQVYLTFDGGPTENTEEILDILQTYQIKATFFVVGNPSEENEAIYKRIKDEGHTLGMRSYSNSFSTIYSSVDAFTIDYDLIHGYLNEVTEEDCKLYRFPGGSGNTVTNVDMREFAKVLKDKGVTYFDWNVSAGDATNDYTSQDVVDNVVAGVQKYKTSVVLLHDGEGKENTVAALGTLIEMLQQQNVQLLPIDENTKVIQYLKEDSIE